MNRVLARELSTPNSFSYKTLDALKNMSEYEFKLFEELVTLSVSGALVKGDYLTKYELNWMSLQKLKEYGLISLDDSERLISTDANDTAIQIINNQYVIVFTNNQSVKVENKISCYLLTSVAKELQAVVSKETPELLAIDIVIEIQKEIKSKEYSVSLHKINFFTDNGAKFNYSTTNIMPDQT